jgi:hypothetical protein
MWNKYCRFRVYSDNQAALARDADPECSATYVDEAA